MTLAGIKRWPHVFPYKMTEDINFEFDVPWATVQFLACTWIAAVW